MTLLSGIVAATVLPFADDGSPDLTTCATFADSLVEAGVGGLAVNADSGEGMSLRPQERRSILREIAGAVGGRVPIVSGLFATSTDEARELAIEAARGGASALLVFPNVHMRGRPLDPQIPLRYLRAIHAASGLPVVAFQLQDALGGVEWEQQTLEQLVTEPYVIAIKESTFDALKFRTTMRVVRAAAPQVSFLTGNDNFVYESFVLGADGALIGAGSIATALQVEMFQAVQARDYDKAAAIDQRLAPLMQTIFDPPIRDYRGRIKAGLCELGQFPNARVREPLLPVTEREAGAVRDGLVHAGLMPAAAAVSAASPAPAGSGE